MKIGEEIFKFQYDNTLRIQAIRVELEQNKFKFQYDNTLSHLRFLLLH